MSSLFREAPPFVRRVVAALMLLALPQVGRAENTPREFSLLLVTTGKPHPTRDAWQRAFIAGFTAVLAKNGHGSLRVLSQPATPRTAAEHLNTGRCSAALLIADDRPWALRRLDQPIFAAHLSLETGRQSIYLLLGTKDEALQVTLRETFAAALADKHFQAIIQGRLPPPPTLALAHSQ